MSVVQIDVVVTDREVIRATVTDAQPINVFFEGGAGGGGGGAVSSVFGRIGDILAVAGDYTTDLVTEGSNLYFTAERAQDAIGSALVDSSTIDFTYNDAGNTITASVIQAGIDHGSISGLGDDDHTQYHTDARALTWLNTRSTSDLPEGSRLYYTDERVDDRVAALIQNGTGLTWTYSDILNTLTGNVSLSALGGVANTLTHQFTSPTGTLDISPATAVNHTANSSWTINLMVLDPTGNSNVTSSPIPVYNAPSQYGLTTPGITSYAVALPNNQYLVSALSSNLTAERLLFAGAGLTSTDGGAGGNFTLDVVGTANRILVNADSIDIASTYVGQTSITTLGTIATGTWQATKVGLAYGGTNADLSATGGTSNYLKQSSIGAAITVGTIPASDIASGAALTKTDDTNVTLTLGGSPTTALLAATSLTLGWTGQLGATRGGTGQSAVTTGDMLYGSASNTWSRLADVAAGSYLRSGGVTTAPVWSTLILPNAATANQMPYSTSTNTWGYSSNLSFNGTRLALAGATSNSTGLLLGSDVTLHNPSSGQFAMESLFTIVAGVHQTAKLNVDLGYSWPYGVTLSVVGTNGTGIRFTSNLVVGDGVTFIFGNQSLAGITWEVGGGSQKQYIKFTQVIDTSNANANPLDASGLFWFGNLNAYSYVPEAHFVDPVLHVHSFNDGNANEYIRFFHDRTDANVKSGTGNINLIPASTKAVKVTGDLKLGTAGNGHYVKEGTNATMGVATLVAGTVTVSTTKVTANSRIFLEVQSLGTVAVATPVAITARTAGTSFTISSSSITDTSVIAWWIVEPA